MTRWMLSSAAMAALTLLLRGALKKRLSPRELFFCGCRWHCGFCARFPFFWSAHRG